MATETMHRRLGRTNNDRQKLSIRRKFKEENIFLRTSLEEWEAVTRWKFNRRSAFLTLLVLEPDDTMRVMSVPLRCHDGTNFSGSGARMNMESLRLFYTKPPDPLTVIRPNVPQGSHLVGIYCGKSNTNGISTVSSPKQQCQIKELANEATKWNELSSSMMETGSSSKSFSDSISGSENVDNTKRNSIKRRKKGKKGKKLSGASSSSGPHLLSVEFANGSPAPGTCGNSGGSGHCGPVSLLTSPEPLLPESGVKNESLTPCTYHHEELEVDIPSADNFVHQGELQESELSWESCQKSVNCSAFSSMMETGSSSKNFSDSISDSEKVDNVKRYSIQIRKKGKKGRKLSGTSSSTEPHLLSVEYANGSSAPGTCGNSGGNGHCGPVSRSTFPEASLPDIPSAGNLGNQGVLQDSEFPTNDGLMSIPHIEMNHYNDLHARGYSDMDDSFVSDSVSVGSNCDDNSDGQDENSAEKEILKNYEQSSCSSGEGYVSCQSFLNDDLDSDDSSERMRWELSAPVYLPHMTVEAGGQLQEETSCAESTSSGSVNHNSAHVHSDEQADKSWTPTDATKEITQNVSSREMAVCIGQGSGDLNAVEAESNRILEAVNNSWRAQMASEAIQTATGGPFAEFERLLYHSSPVLEFIRCQTCSRNREPGSPVCGLETNTISLGCLWKWYQRNGSYGLEIRAEEFRKSKGLGAGRGAFRAYFVPYLSGIQLFRSCRIDSVCTTEVSGEKSETTKSLVNEHCISKQSSAPVNNAIRITSSTGSSDLELLFEYFESEQPQQRQPLYDKIKELIRGDQPNSNVYGDPAILETINLNDLHPRSWYAVAWYPIYRIPRGNLRAAFLTYHSLGHLVHRSARFESPGLDAHMVSPVVGLQSYNAQDECWFQVRHTGPRQTTATPGPGINSYSEVLEERLRTLEETASLMARAVVKKGSRTSVNRHPDYEFFLSRRWCR